MQRQIVRQTGILTEKREREREKKRKILIYNVGGEHLNV